MRNVDGSFQQWRVGVMFTYMAVELTDMAMVMVCTLIEMVILPPVKCMHNQDIFTWRGNGVFQ